MVGTLREGPLRALGRAAAEKTRRWGFGAKTAMQVRMRKTRGAAMAGKLTKQEKSWILYDVGNSAFVL